MPVRINKIQPGSPAPEGGSSTIDGAAATLHNPLATGSQGYRSTTPLPDFYSTQAIVEAIKFWVPPAQFLLDNFFGIERYYRSRFLSVGTRRAKRVLSPVVSRFHRGIPVKRPAVETHTYEVPKLAPYRTIFLSELDVTNIGSVVATQSGDATDVFADLLADDTTELADLIMRRTELFASQILNTGKVRYRLDGEAYEEFGYGANVPTQFTPAIPWSDHANATPLSDLKMVRKQIVADTGSAPDILVMSDEVADHFTQCEQVLIHLDKLHYIVGQVQPTRPAGTAQWLGRLLLPSLEMWAYSEEYIDEFDGVSLAPMIPEHRAIVGTTAQGGGGGFQYWGNILQMDEGGFADIGNQKLIPRLLYETPNEIAQYRLQARPCLIPWDVASWTVVNAIAPVVPPPPLKARNHTPALPTEESEPEPRIRKGVK